MWIFGFGSLMTDGWEATFDCKNREIAQLDGYRRVFNKLSVANWGTHDCPCPTLNLEEAEGATCVGVAFEFDDSQGTKLDVYLVEREGKGFLPREVRATLRNGRSVVARVWVYGGRHSSFFNEPEALVRAVRQAAGHSGRCYDYVERIHSQLSVIGIDDPAVTHLWRTISGQ
ncbi:gamma-glutamylcyclotransferase [Paraburkholderia bannensis]|uniref:gamma-glutamylcyclotransferase n=1 Tax=Paraburkholderia bannensis TaxID=765414 RepID=UPI002ABE69A7|nr:gamma-glutamylcyclotransferase [Paraburkholderia bannensis]